MALGANVTFFLNLRSKYGKVNLYVYGIERLPGKRLEMRVRWRLAVGCATVLIYIGAMIWISLAQQDYAVSVTAGQSEYQFSASEAEYVIPVSVDNRANRMLTSTDDQRCFLSYHLYDGEGKLLEYDNVRTEFINRIFSGQTAQEEIRISGLESGVYQVSLDVVKEGEAWFSEEGADCDTVRIIVR